MHIVQCYELEEKSAEGYFKGVLRDTTTIGRWTLERNFIIKISRSGVYNS